MVDSEDKVGIIERIPNRLRDFLAQSLNGEVGRVGDESVLGQSKLNTDRLKELVSGAVFKSDDEILKSQFDENRELLFGLIDSTFPQRVDKQLKTVKRRQRVVREEVEKLTDLLDLG